MKKTTNITGIHLPSLQQYWLVVKNKQTQQVKKLFGNELSFKDEYEILHVPNHKTNKTQQQNINAWILKEQKAVKLSELQKAYEHKNNWIVTIKDTEGNTLTHEIDWLKSNLAQSIFFFSDKGKPIHKRLKQNEMENIRSNFILLSFKKKERLKTIKQQIHNAQSEKDLKKVEIDFNLPKEFALDEIKTEILDEKKA